MWPAPPPHTPRRDSQSPRALGSRFIFSTQKWLIPGRGSTPSPSGKRGALSTQSWNNYSSLFRKMSLFLFFNHTPVLQMDQKLMPSQIQSQLDGFQNEDAFLSIKVIERQVQMRPHVKHKPMKITEQIKSERRCHTRWTYL